MSTTVPVTDDAKQPQRRASRKIATATSNEPQNPQRTPSALNRLGIAPIDFIPSKEPRAFAPEDLPARSPEGAQRTHSSLMRKQQAIVAAGASAATGAAATAGPQVDVNYPWHTATLEEVFAHLNTREAGLTDEEAAAMLAKVGPNLLTPADPPTFIGRFIGNLTSPFSIMLIFAGVLATIITIVNSAPAGADLDVQDLALAISLYLVALLTSLFQTMQENASDKLMDELRALTAESAWVVRGGVAKCIPAADIVPGDIVQVNIGEKVPADLRIVSANALKVNNSALTGEPMDIKLGLEPNNAVYMGAKNVAFSGCSFTSGNGTGVVCTTGDHTVFGQIAFSATQSEKPDTLMRREVRRLIIIMAIAGVLVSFSFFGAALGTGRGWTNAIIVLVGLFTANIPEGLLPQITIALTITARRMKECQVIVSNLEIIETLGAVSTICTDKTGTLTKNQMTVSHLVYDGRIHMTPFAPVLPEDDPLPIEPGHAAAQALLRNATLNTTATFVDKKDTDDISKWVVKGDASEAALIRFVQERQDLMEVRSQHPILAQIPFSARTKWMAMVRKAGPGKQFVFLKGAAERVLLRCDSYMSASGAVALDDTKRKEIDSLILNLARRGERVLGFAETTLNFADDYAFEGGDEEQANFPLGGLCFSGMVSLVDPPRDTVKKAIADCHKAGIHVIMVTGDHPVTALAISRALGLVTLPTLEEAGPDAKPEECAAVVNGDTLDSYSAEDWDRVLSCPEHVFARTQPEQKKTLVMQLHERGQIVAMTGDGVNDAPALKQANVGVAVGSGTAVAKEAAQIIIQDDDFNSIVIGVREGRQIFDNLKKAVTYVVTHLCPETLPYVFNFAVGVPLAMETIIIILIDLGADMLPGISLAYEECEDRIMEIPPRSADEHLVQPRMLMQGYVFTGFLQTFFCYWAFYQTFYGFGFTFNQLIGADSQYRLHQADMDSSYIDFYTTLCKSNAQWLQSSPTNECVTTAGFDNFMDHFNSVVSQAQGAYFINLVVMQFANLINRRNQSQSVFSMQQKLNVMFFVAIVVSTIYIVILVYVPGLNKALYLDGANSGYVCSGFWGIVVIIAFEELRKAIVRKYPDGFVARWTLY